jgi:hypothetical protein
MGLERIVSLANGLQPDWPLISSRLRDLGESPIIRMIDGMPAFPDEVPADWKEIRVGLAGGMVTLRKSANQIACVCWGTEDPLLKASFERLITALSSKE